MIISSVLYKLDLVARQARRVGTRARGAATIPGAPKMSVDETNEWIRKSRDREI